MISKLLSPVLLGSMVARAVIVPPVPASDHLFLQATFQSTGQNITIGNVTTYVALPDEDHRQGTALLLLSGELYTGLRFIIPPFAHGRNRHLWFRQP